MVNKERKIKKILEFADDKDLALFEALDESTEAIEEAKNAIESLEKIKGDQGAQGDKGDQGEKGEKGDQGERGEKGEPGRNGKDGLDGQDGLDGLDGANGENGKDGADGKDGSPDTAEDIRNKLQSLKDDDRLPASAIKDLFTQEHFDNLEKSFEQRFADALNRIRLTAGSGRSSTVVAALDDLTDVVISSPSSGQLLQFNGTNWVNATVSGTGDVTAALSFGTDNVVIRSDGTGKGVQSSGITIDDSNNISGVVKITTSGDIELGHASDTTLSRLSAGVLGVEGKTVMTLPTSPADFTVTNGTTDRTFNADSTTVDELADVLATLIADLTALGLLQ
jgi:hypothetical protein